MSVMSLIRTPTKTYIQDAHHRHARMYTHNDRRRHMHIHRHINNNQNNNNTNTTTTTTTTTITSTTSIPGPEAPYRKRHAIRYIYSTFYSTYVYYTHIFYSIYAYYTHTYQAPRRRVGNDMRVNVGHMRALKASFF